MAAASRDGSRSGGKAPCRRLHNFATTQFLTVTEPRLAATREDGPVQLTLTGKQGSRYAIETSTALPNSYGAITSAVAALTVLVRARIVHQSQSQTVLEGGTVTFIAAASGTAPLSFRWIRNGVTFTNGIIVNTAMTSSLTLTNVSMTNNGKFFRTAVTNLAGAAPASVNARLSVLADFDRDGMADEWEARYGFDTNAVADAALDLDADGMSNRDEYLTGTDPTNALSLLKINLIGFGVGGLNLQFFAASNRTYRVLFAASLPATAWEKLADIATQPSNRLYSVSDPTAPTLQRFYRVVVPQGP